MYHKVDEMKSLTVLEEEIALCNKIIEFKKIGDQIMINGKLKKISLK